MALNNYKIIHISDLHLGGFNNVGKLEEAIEMINSESPDLVVFTGDLVNNYYEEAIPYIDSLKKIKSKDGKLSILGNHDYCDYVMLKRDSQEWKTNFKKLFIHAQCPTQYNLSRIVSLQSYRALHRGYKLYASRLLVLISVDVVLNLLKAIRIYWAYVALLHRHLLQHAKTRV